MERYKLRQMGNICLRDLLVLAPLHPTTAGLVGVDSIQPDHMQR
ncbi:MAG: hypothetical protein ACJAYX_003826 [Planctomycetota bacterium]|jgi:hypothetical protein